MTDGYDTPGIDPDLGGDGEGDYGSDVRGGWWKSALAVLISLAIIVGGGFVVYTKVLDKAISLNKVEDYPGPGDEEVVITIPDGATLTQIGEILVREDVIASVTAFRKATNANSEASAIQPGRYRLRTKMTASDAVSALLDPNSRVITQVTVREGLRNSDVVTVLAEGTGIPAADFEAAMADAASLDLPAWAPANSEGLLFPETYAYDEQTTAVGLVQTMSAHFSTVAEELDFEAKARALGMEPYEALIVASIIEKETMDPAYGPDIAQVIYNRLRLDMKLQLDSTVIYANNSSGTITTTDEERANPSPYNTYVHQGLPPGPISNPGRSSLEAAVNPTSGDYLYFVATNPTTGETKFATDDEGHAANVAEFQGWCRDNPEQC